MIPQARGYATVTLTTYRPRQWAAMLAVDSLSRGTLRPARVLLFLDGRTYNRERLPFPLAVLVRRGVEVVILDDDYGTYTKLPLFAWRPDPDWLPVVTIDDDVLYPADWLQRLHDEAARGGNEVLCYLARRITLRDAGRFAPYGEWELVNHGDPAYDLLPLGVFGVLYRDEALEAIRAKGLGFRQLAPNRDDLWVRFCTLERGLAVRRVIRGPVSFRAVPFSERAARWPVNVEGGGNDQAIARIAPLFDLSRLR